MMIYEIWAKAPVPHKIGRTYASPEAAEQQMRTLIIDSKFAVADLFTRVRLRGPARRTRR
jgi:hypothetical protein